MTQFNDKSPHTNEKLQKSKTTTQIRHQKLDYTTIANRLRTVSWSNNIHQNGVVKPDNEIPTFRLTAKAVLSKEHTFKNL